MMSLNLLPGSHVEFGKEKYWDDFFSKIRTSSFEWYGEYESLCHFFDKYLRVKDKILVAGCGNSKLSFSLYDVGYCNIVNIDISSTVIKQMTDAYKTKCPLMVFKKISIFEMPYEDGSFNVVLDKGTLDAIMVDVSKETIEKVDQMFAEIARILKLGGRYICISLLQPHILLKSLDWFSNAGWMIRIHRCSEAEKTQENVLFPVFMLIFTKMKKLPGSSSILEIALQSDSPPKRMESVKEVIECIKSIQHFAMIKSHISKRKVIENNLCLELSCTKTGMIKYRLFIVDIAGPAPTEFGVFIVPQGREIEWLFSTPEGRLECATIAKCERVVIVHLLRDFHYENLDEVKKDLSANVMELAPRTLKSQVPFLSIGEDLGTREILKRGKSDLSGDYVIEDSEGADQQMYRRLIFLNNPYLVQTEAKLKRVQNKKKNKKPNWVVDSTFLASNYHLAMIKGLAFLTSKFAAPKLLQIGLGGGGLAMYLYHHFPDANLEIVELDPEIVAIGKHWFGVKEDKHMKITVADGLDAIKNALKTDTVFDVIMLDVDSKDPSLGMSCPPPVFIETVTLKMLSTLIGKDGIVMINLACRNTVLKSEVYALLKSIFTTVCYVSIPNEVNEVVYCVNQEKDEQFLSKIQANLSKLCDFMKKQKNHGFNDDDDIVKTLKFIM